ncbi:MULTISPECIES: DJ-1/PfpI family protein [unclassified Pseudomonas]|jgi:transcriptional regulator GlxA family with amidase domain|uniref:DJ-1/PfpI family protein n=1 Tax=unclassified Pseudomonas TaxID=196821 RepID=UPI000EA8762A|nr:MULTISPECIES: DJ-1/PfpI family protein [unclassified Pseudomonas]AYF86316.1 AraC family transcriptional regulator [Pseudomonas sp. DY-1]MDH4653909.1 AraC family transcriptional regulator [Pseudomonas sp. BN606]MRK22686.1 AraC family transcriptional regulator [Pseudomonas sp. JG-B]
MRIAVLTFEGFNELDSFVAAGLLNRMRGEGWKAEITSPSEWVTSMNGVRVQAQQPLEFANSADVVLFGSGILTRDIAKDRSILDRLQLDPQRQLIGSQCSGALLMARLGLLGSLPACTDLTTKPWVIDAGVQVLDQPFFASGNLATAGGCLSAPYLAAWVIAKLAGEDACATALHYVAPVGEKEAYMERALGVIRPYL